MLLQNYRHKASIAFTTYFTTTRSLNKLFRNALFNFGETLSDITQARQNLRVFFSIAPDFQNREAKIMLDCNWTTKSLYYYYLTTGAVATTKGLKVFGNFVYSCASTTKKITFVCKELENYSASIFLILKILSMSCFKVMKITKSRF